MTRLRGHFTLWERRFTTLYQGRALVAKLDADRSPRTAGSFGIRGIPATIVFNNGSEAAR
ncbi:MAG: thioredoxin domain-containing protein [Gemmatimonadaceae bacterium]|nr:thioredoxin domain-containing protein [Gemmatimonadaceae bacterium]